MLPILLTLRQILQEFVKAPGKWVAILPEERVAGGNGGVHDEKILDAELGAPPLPLLPALPPFSSFQEGIVAPATSGGQWFPKKCTIQRRQIISELSGAERSQPVFALDDAVFLFNFPPSFIFLFLINRRLQDQKENSGYWLLVPIITYRKDPESPEWP